MAVAWDLHYDRRISAAFLQHFVPGGVAGTLAELARYAPYPVDLQLRANPKTGAEHATLYVGLTSVLDVKRKQDRMALVGHGSPLAAAAGFDASWEQPQTAQELAHVWPEVETYLENVLPEATKAYATKEGPVQAAASVFGHHDRIMIDREAALHFRDAATKEHVMSAVAGPLAAAVKDVPGVPGKPPSSFGGECDLLAVDDRGRLLAVEVKPRGAGSIVWSGAQATVYARLFEKWLDGGPVDARPHQPEPVAPVEVLRGMLDQRAQLGLAPHTRPHLADRPEVVPVVAIQRGARPEYLDRLEKVQKALVDAGCGDTRLEVYEVSLAGRLSRLF